VATCGYPALSLAITVREQTAELIEMSTFYWGGVQCLLVGNTTDRLMRLSLPVVVIRAAEHVAWRRHEATRWAARQGYGAAAGCWLLGETPKRQQAWQWGGIVE
jgi:hypothetical protein